MGYCLMQPDLLIDVSTLGQVHSMLHFSKFYNAFIKVKKKKSGEKAGRETAALENDLVRIMER